MCGGVHVSILDIYIIFIYIYIYIYVYYILLQYIRNTAGIEQQMNKHRLTANLNHGGLGVCQLWWSYITRWVTLGQQELQNNGPTQQLTATQYKYIDAVRALGGTVAGAYPNPGNTGPCRRAYTTWRARRRTRRHTRGKHGRLPTVWTMAG